MICFLWFMMFGRIMVLLLMVVLNDFFVMFLIRLFGMNRVVFLFRMLMINNRI